MKKYWKRILLVILLVAILVGIGFFLKKHNKDQSLLTGFTSPDGSFSTEHPRSWDAQISNVGSIVATFVTDSISSTSTIKPYVNIAKGALAGDVNTVYAQTLDKYRKLFKSMQIISETSVKAGGEDAKQVVFDGTLGGRLMRYVVVIIQHSGVNYTLTSSSAPADFAQVEPVINDMIAGWKFLQ